jgi:Fe-S oxidoreductase
MQAAAIVVSLAITLVAIPLAAKAVGEMAQVIRLGRPVDRHDAKGQRLGTLLKETLGHTRMLQWGLVGAAHWFVFVGFGLLFFTLVTAYGQLFEPRFALPLIGHWWPAELLAETITTVMLAAIVILIVIRLARHPALLGRHSRFFGSTMWQGYYVEWTIVGVGICIMLLRGLEGALAGTTKPNLHYSLSFPFVAAFDELSPTVLRNAIWVVATTKIAISMAWVIVIAINLTMGVAWHRFTAFPNIFFKREAGDRTALGATTPMTVHGKPVDLTAIEELDEDAMLGVGKVEDFTWKNLLDFTTCTECGRCQSQCPAWNTEKPLSPKLFITNLRDHVYAKAPSLLAHNGDIPETARSEAERPLVGTEDVRGVIHPDVLWSCTTCGACVQECPVDIEHVDEVIDLRRYEVLNGGSYPGELNGLFRNLENAGNPWGVSASSRMDWAKGLPFHVKQLGIDVTSLDEVEWLFWVGCAGAFDDRAKNTTAATAELLHKAGVSFAVLGTSETCTGDPARRAGNEFLYQMLATQNVAVLREANAMKIVATCAHCFNSLKNEYEQFGLRLEVVHHTQLLNRLVREKRLTPIKPAARTPNGTPITYHDPCYLGRHNEVYEPPRELLGALPGTELREMPRHAERSFCCGAGGARMWMEEHIGQRINVNRTTEALATGAQQIAVGCPFCNVMLSDGVTAAQQDGAGEGVDVVDVAQMLLAAVNRSDSTNKPHPSDS